MLQRYVPIVLVLIAAGLLFFRLANVQGLATPDDAFSYMAASCTDSTDRQTDTFGQWVSVSELQAYYTPTDKWCFVWISNFATSFDVHPPGYYWLLHAWTVIWGRSAVSMRLVNVVFVFLTSLAIYMTARRLDYDRRVSLMIACGWLVSPLVYDNFINIRAYSLISLLSALLLLSCVGILQSPPRAEIKYYAVLTIVLTSMLLTNYLAVFSVGAISVGFVIMYLLYKKQFIKVFNILLVCVVSFMALLLLHSGFMQSFQFQSNLSTARASMTLEEYITRSMRSFEVLLGLIWPKRLIQFLSDYGLLFVAATAVAACFFFLAYLAVKKLRSNQLKPSEVMIALTAVWGILIVSTVQVRFTALSVFPNRYFSGVDVAFVMSLMVFLNAISNKNRHILMNGLAFIFVLSNMSNSFQFYRNQQRHYLPNAVVQADTVLIDIGLTSPLGSITWEMNPDKLAYADFQTNILKSDSFWDSLPSDVIAYVSVITYDMHIHGNNLENRQEILERFKSEGFSVRDTGEYAYGLGYVYILKR